MNNINPTLWGPHAWKILHYITVAYPDNPTSKDKENIKNFFMSFSNVIPCENCRIHFALNLNKYPLTDSILSSKYNLINWLRDIHNEVNNRTGKPLMSYDDLIREYSDKKDNSNNNIEIVTIILLIVIIILIFIYIKLNFYS
jgi:hypothetical protein